MYPQQFFNRYLRIFVFFNIIKCDAVPGDYMKTSRCLGEVFINL